MARHTRSGRVVGYHYARRRDGTKYRVYGSGRMRSQGKGRTRSRPRSARRDMAGDIIMGYGQYTRRSGRRLKVSRPPQVTNSRDGVIIRHREFLLDVPSSAAFSSVTFPLNPGLKDSFPWLSRVAQNFEEWLPRGIIFEFNTTSSDTLIAASPALGSVITATQYNSVNPDFTTKQQMENYQWATSTKPSRSMRHQVETKRSQTVLDELYIRTGPIPANADLRMYDLGKTQVAVVGSQTTGDTLGEVWVNYEVELRKPKIPEDPLVDCAHFVIPAATTGLAPATPFGNSTAIITSPTTGSTMDGITLIGGAALGTVSFGTEARGLYLVSYSQLYTNGGADGVWTFGVTNCTLVNAFRGNTVNLASIEDTVTATSRETLVTVIVNITAPGATLTMTETAGATAAAAAGDMYVIELPDQLN